MTKPLQSHDRTRRGSVVLTLAVVAGAGAQSWVAALFCGGAALLTMLVLERIRSRAS